MSQPAITDASEAKLAIGFINWAHALDHYVMLIFPTVVIGLELVYGRSYAELMGGQSDAAVASAEAALARLPKDENFRFAHGIALVLAGDADAGRAELRALVGARPSWATIIRSFAAQGLLTLPGGVTVDSLLA